MKKKIVPYISVLVAMLIWSAAGIAIKAALLVFRPMTMIVLRFTMSVLLILIVGLIVSAVTRCRSGLSARAACADGDKPNSPGLLSLQLPRVKDLKVFLLAGIMQPLLYYIFETYTYRSLSSPTIAEALLSISPIVAPIPAWLLLRERITVYHIAGILISSVGMLLLVLTNSPHAMSMAGAEGFSIGNPIGILFAFLAVFSAVGYTILLRKMPAYYSPMSIVLYVQLAALLFFYPIWGITEGASCVRDGWLLIAEGSPSGSVALGAASQADVLRHAIEAIAYLAAGASVAAYVLFCYSVRKIGVTETNAFNNVRPVFTALIMLIAFSEQLPIGKWAGIALIVAGLFVCQMQPKKGR